MPGSSVGVGSAGTSVGSVGAASVGAVTSAGVAYSIAGAAPPPQAVSAMTSSTKLRIIVNNAFFFMFLPPWQLPNTRKKNAQAFFSVVRFIV